MTFRVMVSPGNPRKKYNIKQICFQKQLTTIHRLVYILQQGHPTQVTFGSSLHLIKVYKKLVIKKRKKVGTFFSFAILFCVFLLFHFPQSKSILKPTGLITWLILFLCHCLCITSLQNTHIPYMSNGLLKRMSNNRMK